jgi:hypothetical protein
MTNPHSLGWRANLSFKYASRRTRREALRNAAMLLGLLLAYGIVGTIDYAAEQRDVATKAENILLACMNGRAQFITDGPHADGHGKTAVICRTEELKL